MTVREMTLASVTESLEKLVREDPDHIYEHMDPAAGLADSGVISELSYVPDRVCVYYDIVTETPSCIVGHVFADHGIDWSTFRQLVTESRDTDLRPEVVNFMTPAVSAVTTVQPVVESGVAALLNRVQGKQDRGFTWSAAVRLGMAGSY